MPEIIVDKFGKVFPRWLYNIAIHSALCTWVDEYGQEMLVLGSSTVGFPNLVYASYDVITEEGLISDDASVNNEMKSIYRTKNYNFDLPDVEKQIRCIDIIYQDHPDWTDETIVVKYRVDTAGFKEIPTWTTLGTIALGTTDVNNQTLHYNIPDTLLSANGKSFQFQFEATGHFSILKMIIYYDILSKKY